MRNIIYPLFIVSLFSPSLLAESFNDYLNSQQDSSSREFTQFKSTHKDEFELYKKQLQDAFKEYKKTVAGKWGKSKSTVPGKTIDVSYQDNLNQRSIIDYKNGKVKVEVIVSNADAKNSALIQQKMQQALRNALNRGRDKRSIIDIAKSPSQTRSDGPALLSQLVQNQSGGVLSQQQEAQFIKHQIADMTMIKTKGTDNQPRVIITSSFPMISRHLEVRARKYLSPVKKYSANMRLPTELVFAIMETESAFNPNARSSVPAFGLMQLVPTSGARDAYRLLYNKDKVVSDRYLYNPDNNIKMGTAFLHKVYYSYLSGITNPESRTWAMIASYNTGAGNVLRTFAGKYRRSKFGNRSNWKKQALSIINSKTPEQVYLYMKRNLPHKETRHYIAKIRKRISKYKSL